MTDQQLVWWLSAAVVGLLIAQMVTGWINIKAKRETAMFRRLHAAAEQRAFELTVKTVSLTNPMHKFNAVELERMRSAGPGGLFHLQSDNGAVVRRHLRDANVQLMKLRELLNEEMADADLATAENLELKQKTASLFAGLWQLGQEVGMQAGWSEGPIYRVPLGQMLTEVRRLKALERAWNASIASTAKSTGEVVAEKH